MRKGRLVLVVVALVVAALAPARAPASTVMAECIAKVPKGTNGQCTTTWTQNNTVRFGAHLAIHEVTGATVTAASLTWTDYYGHLIYRLSCNQVYWAYDASAEGEVTGPMLECAETNRGSFRPGAQYLTVSVTGPSCGLDVCQFHGRLYICNPDSTTRLRCKY